LGRISSENCLAIWKPQRAEVGRRQLLEYLKRYYQNPIEVVATKNGKIVDELDRVGSENEIKN
jgi:hypothetical protein